MPIFLKSKKFDKHLSLNSISTQTPSVRTLHTQVIPILKAIQILIAAIKHVKVWLRRDQTCSLFKLIVYTDVDEVNFCVRTRFKNEKFFSLY